MRPCNTEPTNQLQNGSLWIAVEAKNIWQDRVQKRVDEHSEDVAMPQIPEEPDEETWLIRLKRFCAQIVDVLIARIQERLAEVSWRSSLNTLSDSERYANRQIVDCHVAQYHRNSSEYHVALGDLAKARAKSRRRTCLYACGTNEPAEGAGAFSKKRVRRRAVDARLRG